MERKKNIWDYAAQVLFIYGVTLFVMNVFCVIVGDAAQGYSTLFSLGGAGIAVGTSFQFFGMSVLIAAYRELFFTDRWIKKMPIATRTIAMLITVILTVVIFVVLFGWFPADDLKCWAMFLVCFGISFVLSFACTLFKERTENRQMEEALRKMQGEER